ncbi:MAG: hypothetical protein LC126_03305, partial [Bryobacterales bacterium]|nr:hypothetical protein [Bryobacterales bacterium]
RMALLRAAEIAGGQRWGAHVKREQVTLPASDIPILGDKESRHNLVEVMNMCATLERLIDALKWAKTALGAHEVEHCHPTTGSSAARRRAGRPDNDLVLVERGQTDIVAAFEVSDIVGKNPAVKHKKDLLSLGALDPGGSVVARESWPQRRLFIVSSQRPGGIAGLKFICKAEAPSVIAEVLPGAEAAGSCLQHPSCSRS